jgi:hypothetical protein
MQSYAGKGNALRRLIPGSDPWGDLVNYFRDVNVTQVKYRLLADAVDQLGPPAGTSRATDNRSTGR